MLIIGNNDLNNNIGYVSIHNAVQSPQLTIGMNTLNSLMLLILSVFSLVSCSVHRDLAVIRAAERGDCARVQTLLDTGASVNTTHHLHGRSLLHIAARNGSYDLCKMLIERGADVNAVEEDSERARRYGSTCCTPLHLAATANHASICRLLLEHGALALIRDDNGRTPLGDAMYMRSFESARVLLRYGAE